jgi:hypothetical protein
MYSTTDKVPKFMKIAVVLAFTAALAAARWRWRQSREDRCVDARSDWRESST